MSKTPREKLYNRFGVRFAPQNDEEKRLLGEVEELVNEFYYKYEFFESNETKPLVMALYSIGMEYIKLKRDYTMQQARIKRLLSELRSLHD